MNNWSDGNYQLVIFCNQHKRFGMAVEKTIDAGGHGFGHTEYWLDGYTIMDVWEQFVAKEGLEQP